MECRAFHKSIMRLTYIFCFLFLYNIPSEAQTVYFSKQYSMFPDLPSQGFRVTTMPDGYAFTTLEGGSTTPKGGILVILMHWFNGGLVEVQNFTDILIQKQLFLSL